MNKIISKPSKTFKSWLAKYLNKYLIDVFISFYTKPFKILRLDQVKKDNEYRYDEDMDAYMGTDFNNPENKSLLKAIKEDKQIIKSCNKIIDTAYLDDLVIHTYNHITNKENYHIMNNSDLSNIGNKLSHFLINDLPIIYKIKWILRNKNISDVSFAKKVNMYPQQINYFKNGKRDIKNMTLKNALNILSCYNHFINKQFIKY